MKFSEKLWKHFPQCVKIFDICAKVQNIGCDKMKYNFNKSGISEGIEFCSISAEGFKSSTDKFTNDYRKLISLIRKENKKCRICIGICVERD